MNRKDIYDVGVHLSTYMDRLATKNYAQYKLDPDACVHVAKAVSMYVQHAFNDVPEEKTTQKTTIVSVTIKGAIQNA